jgi:polyisoprenoid-binding protein YceI
MNSTAIEQQTTYWTVDRDATRVEFAVKTFWGLMTIRGCFDRFDGSYELGSNGDSMKLT